MNEIGKRIKARREELGMSQTELAKKMGYSSYTTIAKIEAGANNLRQTKVKQLAEALDCSPAWLINLDDTDRIENFDKRMTEYADRYFSTPKKVELVNKISNLSDDDIDLVIQIIDKMIDAKKG